MPHCINKILKSHLELFHIDICVKFAFSIYDIQIYFKKDQSCLITGADCVKVVVTRPGLAPRLEEQREHLPDNIEIIAPDKGTDKELIPLVHDAEIIVCSRLSAAVVKAAKQLKLIQKTGAGVDSMPFDTIHKDIMMANTSGSNPSTLAEGTVAMILALAKRIVPRHSLFPGKDELGGIELRGKKLGIIGFGHIGIEIAKRLQAFEMKILGIKRRYSEDLKNQMNLEFLGTPDDLDHLLVESDFVVMVAPLTPATRGMIGERELRLMKSTAHIVNVGRGALIQEEPLYTALKEGWIAGAGLDVWWSPHWWDPVWSPDTDKPSKFPIWELPNVIATPHNVSSTEDQVISDGALKIIVTNINRLSEGKSPINQVDMEHQY